jgi:hypothetical protein
MVLRDAISRIRRRFTEYSGDVSGRYVGALAVASIESGRQFPALDSIVPRLLGLQKPDGHYGIAFGERITKSEMAMLWGNGRMLIGLLEYYRAKPRPETLAAARRLGDFLVKIAPVMNDDDLRRRIDAEEFASDTSAGPITSKGWRVVPRHERCALFAVGRRIAARTKRYPKQHSHGFLSSVRGIVDLYKVTGEKKYLEQAEREWHGVIESGNLLVQGAVGEAFAPNLVRTEGCSEADWLRLTIALWRLTGKPEYLAQAERTLFNEFTMNQFNTGDLGHRPVSDTGTPLGQGSDGGGTARACVLHAARLRAFPDILAASFAPKSEAFISIFRRRPRQDARTGHGRDSTLERDARSTRKCVRRRWAGSMSWRSVSPLANKIQFLLTAHRRIASARRLCRLSRVWKSGVYADRQYPPHVRERTRRRHRVARFHGPWLLARDQVNPYFYDEPRAENHLAHCIADDGAVSLERAGLSRLSHSRFGLRRVSAWLSSGRLFHAASTAILRPVPSRPRRVSSMGFQFPTAE